MAEHPGDAAVGLDPLAEQLLDALESSSCLLDPDGRILAVNRAWTALAALHGDTASAVGQDYLAVCERAARSESSDAGDAAAVAEGLRSVLTGRQPGYRREYPCHSPGVERWFDVRVSPIEVSGTRGALVRHVDVSARHLAQDALARDRLTDPVTGEANRALLMDRLHRTLQTCDAKGCAVAVTVVDLDRFRRVNESLGHDAGDDLLRQVAERLVGALRATDTLGRTGSNEFTLVWDDVVDAADAEQRADRVREALGAPYPLDGVVLDVSASTGTAVGRPPDTAGGLLQAAVASLHQMRHAGRSAVTAASSTELQAARDRIVTESELRLALHRDELALVYQPVVELATGRVVGVEALVRWDHPRRGRLLPAQFLPAAEGGGLMAPLGRWVLERATADAAAHPALAGLDVGVNVSARQFVTTDLVADVQDALGRSGLAPERLLLEVTESAMMTDEAAAERALFALAGLGVQIAIDDFGTGYSSLLYVRRFPVHVLKLDLAFVQALDRPERAGGDDAAICSSVVRLAEAVGGTCIAEGVETPAQQARLRAMGCTYAVGFLWSPGVPLSELQAATARARAVPLPASAPHRRRHLLPGLDPGTEAQLVGLHRAGASLHTIAAALNRAGAPHPAGTRWKGQSVARYVDALVDGPDDEHDATTG